MSLKVQQMLGLAMRAGAVTSGEAAVIEKVRKGHIYLVILAEDASANTRKKVLDKCKFYRVPCVQFLERDTLGHVIGKEERVVIGLTNSGFADRIRQLIEDCQP